jgi:hypothetical protein
MEGKEEKNSRERKKWTDGGRDEEGKERWKEMKKRTTERGESGEE